MAPLTVDVYWSFRSPYSYLVTPRIIALRREHSSSNLELCFRPVLPLMVRLPHFFEKANPKFPQYLMKVDAPRVAEYLGLPFQWPSPDPVQFHVDDKGVHRTNDDQPYIYRLTQLGLLAAQQGKGFEFAEQVSKLIWTTTDWDRGTLLKEAVGRAGLDLAELDEMREQQKESLAATIDANQAALDAAGHWGVPTFVFNGEPFFGQDRLEMLVWRLKQHGLER